MRILVLANVVALALAGNSVSADAFSGPSGTGKTNPVAMAGSNVGGHHVPPLALRRYHAICASGKPCGRSCIARDKACHK
jgi:hypothetical protein